LVNVRPFAHDKAAAPFLQGLAHRVAEVHADLRRTGLLAGINRVAVALYDPHTEVVKAFVHSSDGPNPLDHAASRLSDVPSLAALASGLGERVINDLEEAARLGRDQAGRLVSFGYRSSYTVPVLGANGLQGFLFFNAFAAGFFGGEVVERLAPYRDLLIQMVLREIDSLRMIQALVKVIMQISVVRDGETGAHLARMARYTQLIALSLSDRYGLSDEYIESLFQFAPIHDVGKIGVPDHILLKPGPLNPAEFQVMKGHVERGLEIIDVAIEDFGLGSFRQVDMMRSIIAGHHEKLDGSGYPKGLSGDMIPLEARIVAVADVFDALTSRRPYKMAWSNREALALLRTESWSKFDPECVAALAAAEDEVKEIQALFGESPV